MQSAIRFCLLAALVGLAAADPTDNWTSLHVTWGAGSIISKTLGIAYFAIPSTQKDAEKEGWTQATSDDITTTWCLPNDPRVCALYDNQGTIAGLRVSVPANDVKVKGNPYPMDKHNIWNRATLMDTDVWSGTYYLVDQATLLAGGRSNPTKLGNGLWIKSGDNLLNIPLTGDELVEQSWTRENCIPEMGRHYYYNVSETMDCKDFEPAFLITNPKTDEVLGLGLQTFGQVTKKNRGWLEDVPSLAIKPTLPNAPQCLVDWAKDYGVISLHMYFVKNPWYILC